MQARLYELKRQEAEASQGQERRQQIGTAERHERIRTYNFPQDRVTDHRIGLSVHGVEEFMTGEEGLENLMEQLQAEEEARALRTLLARYQRPKK